MLSPKRNVNFTFSKIQSPLQKKRGEKREEPEEAGMGKGNGIER